MKVLNWLTQNYLQGTKITFTTTFSNWKPIQPYKLFYFQYSKKLLCSFWLHLGSKRENTACDFFTVTGYLPWDRKKFELTQPHIYTSSFPGSNKEKTCFDTIISSKSPKCYPKSYPPVTAYKYTKQQEHLSTLCVYAALFLPFSHPPPRNQHVTQIWKTTYTDPVKKTKHIDNIRMCQVEETKISIWPE